MASRVLKSGYHLITNTYAQHLRDNGWAKGIDVVKPPSNLDYVVAHSNGKVIYAGNDHRVEGYGNFVMINHGAGYVTVYGHLDSVEVRNGQIVKRGDVLGLMGATGRAFGEHLHFSVRVYNKDPEKLAYLHDVKDFVFIDPTRYLEADLPLAKEVFRVQEGAYAYPAYAKKLVEKLIKEGYKPITKLYADGLIHVQTNAFESRAYAEAHAKEVRDKGFKTYITTEDGVDITI